jgi:hypothetical protein
MLEEKFASLDILSIQRDLAEVKELLLLILKQEAGDRDVTLLSRLQSIEGKIEKQSSITVEDDLDAL